MYIAVDIDATLDDWGRETWTFDVHHSTLGFIGRYAARSRACITILLKALNRE